MNFVNNLLGLNVERLNACQMMARTVVVFLVALLYVRVAGIRTFGKKSSFDQVTTLILGTLLGNAIFTGKAPFIPLLLASLVLVLLHRITAWATFKSHKLGEMIKGKPITLIEGGKLNEENLKKTLITKDDIDEYLRLNGNEPDVAHIKAAYVERSGNVSLIEKK